MLGALLKVSVSLSKGDELLSNFECSGGFSQRGGFHSNSFYLVFYKIVFLLVWLAARVPPCVSRT